MKRLSLVAVVVLFAVSATATVFQPRTDVDLYRHADAVVLGTVLDATCRATADGMVVTDYRLTVERTVKGDARGVITITEFGGVLPGKVMAIAESARYTPGEHVFLFLRQREDGNWLTESMALGKFGVVSRGGRQLLARDGTDVREFESSLRNGTSKFGADKILVPAANGAGAYGLVGCDTNNVCHPLRWLQPAPGATNLAGNCNSGCTVQFVINGTDTTGSIPKGFAAWTNDPNSWISLTSGAQSFNSTASYDSANVIYLNSSQPPPPNTEVFCDGAMACTIGWGNGSTHVWGGDTFYNIYDADIIVRPGVAPSQMDALITHELGHSIGIRHSDAGQPASSNAIMASTVPAQLGANLQQWDKDAVDSLYGNGPVCAVPTQVTTTPTGSNVVNSGTTVQINAFVGAGTPPFHYQWYNGATGDVSYPVGTDSSSFTTPPITSTSSYWVMVTNGCGSAPSPTVTFQAAAQCVKPAITTNPTDTSASSGGTAQLTVGATGTAPLSYQWYIGAQGDISNPAPNGTQKDFTTPALTQTTSFWVRVANGCGFADSAAALVRVASCGTGPQFTIQPASMTIDSGGQAYLIAGAAAATGYQWYQGTAPDTSTPLTGLAPSNARFVQQLYLDLLHRPPDPGANALIALLDSAAATRFQVASNVINSNEYRTLLIRADYETFLRRDPSNADIAAWLPAFTGGMTWEQFEAQILGSPEYFALAGGTNALWLNQIFSDVLHRAPSPFDVAAFSAALSTNSRTTVAQAIVSSPEARSALIEGWYVSFLHRPMSSTEIGLLPAVQSQRDEVILGNLLASPEYFGFATLLPIGPLTKTTSFWVQASNGCASTASNTAIIAIRGCDKPTITGYTGDQTIGVGNTTSLGVIATGPGPLSYQWYQGTNGDTSKPVQGQTQAVLSIPIDTPGTYQFWVRVTNNCGIGDGTSNRIVVTCSNAPALFVNSPAAMPSGVPYVVKVDGRLQIYSKFELQESTSADFAGPITYTSSNGIFNIPAHSVSTDTRYFYRVRGTLSCTTDAGPFSTAGSTLVVAPPPANALTFNLLTPPCVTGPCSLTQPMFIPGLATSGKRALDATDQFFVSVDKPWLKVTPDNGPLPPQGTTVTLSIDTTNFPAGSTEATVSIVRVTASSSLGVLGSTSTSTPVSVSLVSGTTPKPKDPNAPINTLLIPAIAHADGAGGSHFQSDVRLTNTSNQSISYQLTFTPSNTDGTTSGKSTTINVDAGATTALNDVVKNFFGGGAAGDPGAGTLEIRPLNFSGKDASVNVQFVTVAASRTYNTTSAGTYGQFIPALPIANFLGKSAASLISLQQVAESAAYRTNLGFAEGAGQPADLVVTLFGADGTQLAQRALHLLAYQQTQSPMAGFFGLPGGSIPEGRVQVEVTSDTGKVTAYASVLDNQTSDPLLVFPTDPSKITTSRYVVPGVAELNNGAANFHTDMRIFNGGTSDANVTLTYVPQGGGASPAPLQFKVAAGAVKPIDNVLPNLWSLTNTGGAVIATTDADSRLVFTARTYSRNNSGGTYGQFIPGVTANDAVGLGDNPLNVVQLEESPSFRSNLGLVEITGNPVTLEIKGYAPDSKVAATVQKSLGPGEFTQVGRILAAMGFNGNVYNGRVSVRVIDGTGKVAAYGSVIDNRTQDPTYVPAE